MSVFNRAARLSGYQQRPLAGADAGSAGRIDGVTIDLESDEKFRPGRRSMQGC